MKSNRLEAFSDGVLAIIITIMVLGMKVPKGANFASLKEVLPSFISYLLSYAYVGIYWNNHHHLFQAIEKVNGKILWANLLLLFCLSLLPVFIYCINLLLCAITYTILEKIAIKHEGKDSIIGKALENKTKEYASTALYIFAIVFSLYSPLLGFIGYSIVALIWIIPDRRIEKQLN